jgi:predicted Fe-Mo cluster-binding NifX family protein
MPRFWPGQLRIPPVLVPGTVFAFLPGVTIAMPVLQGRISPVLDTAARLLVVTRRRGEETARREIVLSPLRPEELARGLAELDADVLLCAALSEPLQRALEHEGVRFRSHLCGEIEAVLRAFHCGQLGREEFQMPGCWGRHHRGACCRRRRASHKNFATMQETK